MRSSSMSIGNQESEKVRGLTWMASEADWEESEAFIRDLAGAGGRPSSTANGVAAIRATELTRPVNDRICDDPLAAFFVGPKLRFLMKSRILTRVVISGVEVVVPGLLGYVARRTRYVDGYLVGCRTAGFRQVVFLGAGYDSRTYRLDLASPAVKVFEVDSPATQREKLSRARKAFGSFPKYVTYVALDFDRDKLDRRITETGYDTTLKTLFIWEGVSYYVTAKAVDEILGFVVENSGPGSTILFDYVYESFLDGKCRLRGARRLTLAYKVLWRLIFRREPFIFGIDPQNVEDFLCARGFRLAYRTNGDYHVPGCRRNGICFVENLEAVVREGRVNGIQ